MKIINFFMIALIGLSTTVQAEITPLKIDKSQKKTNIKYIKAAHNIIKHESSQERVRFAILNAALSSGDIKWLLEEDGGDYLVLRWDYSGEVIYTKVEFDAQYIQLKYLESSEDYRCINNVAGICYKNESRNYYKYMKGLRNRIIATLPKKVA